MSAYDPKLPCPRHSLPREHTALGGARYIELAAIFSARSLLGYVRPARRRAE